MKYLRWLPFLCWITIICFLSFSDLKTYSVPQFFSADKVAHLIMYGVLSWTLYLAAYSNVEKYRNYLIIGILFSFLTEIIQHYCIVNRYGELGDFLANLLGLGIVYIFIWRKK